MDYLITGGKIFSKAGDIIPGKAAAKAPTRAVLNGIKSALKNGPAPVKGVVKTKRENVRIHGNSLDYKGPTHVYKIVKDGKTQKFGESTQGLNKYGQSKRAETQARRLQRETGEDHKTEVIQQFTNKRDAKAFETKIIKETKKADQNALPLNKTNH